MFLQSVASAHYSSQNAPMTSNTTPAYPLRDLHSRVSGIVYIEIVMTKYMFFILSDFRKDEHKDEEKDKGKEIRLSEKVCR